MRSRNNFFDSNKLMKSHFRISKKEFVAFLSQFVYCEAPEICYEFDWEIINRRWDKIDKKTNEYLYLINLDDDFAIKVFSSIDKKTDMSREYGDDAIRLLPVVKEDLRPLRCKARNIYRVKNWRSNFVKGMDELLIELGSDMKCKKCGGKMRVRKNRNKKVNFLSCSKYFKTGCNYTNNIVVKSFFIGNF